MNARLPWLLLALATTAALAAFGDPPADIPAPMTEGGEHLPTIRVLNARVLPPIADGDPFAIEMSPLPEPSALASAALPAPSYAAPLRWQVIGKQYAEGDGWTVFLARGNETWVVRVGDTLDTEYRVLTIAPPTLTLQHLKQNTRRTLDIGDARE